MWKIPVNGSDKYWKAYFQEILVFVFIMRFLGFVKD